MLVALSSITINRILLSALNQYAVTSNIYIRLYTFARFIEDVILFCMKRIYDAYNVSYFFVCHNRITRQR